MLAENSSWQRQSVSVGQSSVVITGLGAVSAAGTGTEALWQGLIRGQSLIETRHDKDTFRGLQHLPASLAITGGFLPQELFRQNEPLHDPLEAAAVAAAREAWASASGDGQFEPVRIGCAFGTSKGGVYAATQAWQLSREPARSVSVVDRDVFLSVFPHEASRLVATICGARGPCSAPIAACATGLAAAMQGARWIEEGLCDVVITGSADASLHPLILAAFQRLGVLASQRNLPEGYSPQNSIECRPFDKYRHGFLVGEGAGCLVLERESSAVARGQKILARWRAGRQLTDAASLMQPDPQAQSLQRLIAELLKSGRCDTQDLGYVNAHGTGTRLNDQTELMALQQVLGSSWLEELPVSSFKGTIGHLLGAAGSVELVGTVLALDRRVVPPTANRTQVDREFEKYLLPAEALPMRKNVALKLSSGFGGHLMGVLLERPEL